MNKLAIRVLQDEINEKLELISNYIIKYGEEGKSDDQYTDEWIDEMREDVLELRRAIATLKVFSMNDLIEDLLKVRK